VSLKLSDFPQIAGASVDQKIALIDQIWEQVRRASSEQDVRATHLETLDKRLKMVQEDLTLALSPSEARSQLRK